MKTAKKRNWLITALCVLLACGIVGSVVSGILFASDPANKTYASATIEFSFDGAAEGIAPNGYSFSISDMVSDEVLEKALADAGMTDRYNAAQIRPRLIITGVFPENIVEQMTSYESQLDFSANREVMARMYHPTLYAVTLDNSFDKSISKGDLEKLLQCMLDAYKRDFAAKHSVGTLPVDLRYDLEQYDYPQRLILLQQVLEEAEDYANDLYEEASTLRKNGTGFNDIAVKLNNLISNDLDQLDASVTINALTTNKERLITQYTYSKETLEEEYVLRSAQKVNLTNLISSYELDDEMYMSTSDSTAKIESNTADTYESLQQSLETVNNRMIAIKSAVQRYMDRLGDLGEKTETTISSESTDPTAEESETVESEAMKSEFTNQISENSPAAPTDAVETGIAQPANGTEPAAPAAGADTPVSAAVYDEETAVADTAEPTEEITVVSSEDYDRLEAELVEAIRDLDNRRMEIMATFAELIALYNEKQINDLTVTVANQKYYTPSFFSGAFAVHTVKVAGPFVAVGFMVCLVLIIRSRRKEQNPD